MSYYNRDPLNSGWKQEDAKSIDQNYLNYLAGELNNVSKSTKNQGRLSLQQYMADMNLANGETQTPQDYENMKQLAAWYATTKDGRGTTLESFQSQYGKNFGSWKNAGSAESQGHVSAYGQPGANGLVQTGQKQDNAGQSQYPAMANEYGFGSQQGQQNMNVNPQATTPAAAGTTNQSMMQQPGGQAVPTQQPLTQQAGSESSRGFNPWSLIGESIARSR